MKTLYLHIGTHKTGSTSLQRWLSEHKLLLQESNYGLFEGEHLKSNHIELYLAAMRYNRDSFGKQSMPEINFDEEYTAAVASRVQAFIAQAAETSLVFSTEGLSLLRHEDELSRLKEILGTGYGNIKIVVYLRNREDYLHSYRTQLQKKRGRKASMDYWSALYVEDDTWLVDYQELVAVYSNAFGAQNVVVIDYEQSIAASDNIIPSFLEEIGLTNISVDTKGLHTYRDNMSVSSGHFIIRLFTQMTGSLRKLLGTVLNHNE